jgi:hypothetical protein
VDNPSPDSVLTLLPEVEVRAALAGRALVLSVLRPPYPALGTGTLRVLRVRDAQERTELVVGYDGYERIPIDKP